MPPPPRPDKRSYPKFHWLDFKVRFDFTNEMLEKINLSNGHHVDVVIDHHDRKAIGFRLGSSYRIWKMKKVLFVNVWDHEVKSWHLTGSRCDYELITDFRIDDENKTLWLSLPGDVEIVKGGVE
jgi:hypothetical protein